MASGRDRSLAESPIGHFDVWVRGYVDQVVIGCSGEITAACAVYHRVVHRLQLGVMQ